VFGVFPHVKNGLKYWERLAYWEQSQIFRAILIIQNSSLLGVKEVERGVVGCLDIGCRE